MRLVLSERHVLSVDIQNIRNSKSPKLEISATQNPISSKLSETHNFRNTHQISENRILRFGYICFSDMLSTRRLCVSETVSLPHVVDVVLGCLHKQTKRQNCTRTSRSSHTQKRRETTHPYAQARPDHVRTTVSDGMELKWQ